MDIRAPLAKTPPALRREALKVVKAPTPAARSVRLLGKHEAKRARGVVRFKEEDDLTPTILEQLRSTLAHATGNVAPVVFQLNKQCRYGDAWGVLGSTPELGAWDTTKPLPLQWHAGDKWCAMVHLPLDTEVEFKFVVLDAKGNAFKGWAKEVAGNKNIQMTVRKGSVVDSSPGFARVMDEAMLSSTGTVVVSNTTVTPTDTITTVVNGPVPLPTSMPVDSSASTHEGPVSSGGVMPASPSAAIPAATPDADPSMPTPSAQDNGPAVPHVKHPVVAQVSGAPGTFAFDTANAPINSDAPAGSATPGNIAPDNDLADPANQMVMTPAQAQQPQVKAHIEHDTLTTDTQLAGGPCGEPGDLPYMDQSSIKYRLGHAPPPPPSTPTPPQAAVPTVTPDSQYMDTSNVTFRLSHAPPPPPPTTTPHEAAPPTVAAHPPGYDSASTPPPSALGGIGAGAETAAPPATSSVGPFTLGTSQGSSSSAKHGPKPEPPGGTQQRKQDAGGEQAGTDLVPQQPAPAQHTVAEQDPNTLAADAGLEVPVDATTHMAGTILSIVTADEELPSAPLDSGITPITGASAAAGASMLNPKHNPKVMAMIIETSRSLFDKVAGLFRSPEEVEAPLETAAAQQAPRSPTTKDTDKDKEGSPTLAPDTVAASPDQMATRRTGTGIAPETKDNSAQAPESGTQR